MSTHVPPHGFDPGGSAPRATDLLRIRRIGVDDWSDVRYVHAMSFRTFVAPRVSHQYTDAFTARLREPGYVDQFCDTALTGAWLDGELAGTAGWSPVEGRERAALIEGMFVNPLFAFMGIGSALLAHAENDARKAGCETFVAVVPSVSASFPMRFGYEVTAHLPPSPDVDGDHVRMLLLRKRDAGGDLYARTSGH